MYYRRKILLALIEVFGGNLEKIRLQKLLFLFCQKQIEKDYSFVPYKYGCYSYSASADLNTMISKGLLKASDDDGYIKVGKNSYLKLLKPDDKKLMLRIQAEFGSMNGNELMRHTYISYPYFAINSLRASEILNNEEYETVRECHPKGTTTTLFTIGYEGIPLEDYLNKLIKNDVKVLVDVRRNPLSMKFGFSKGPLSKYCSNLNIQYLHLPQVGIESDLRQNLENQEDYDALFLQYRKETLTKTAVVQTQILNLLIQHQRIALTCFESNICQCHRKHLAEAIQNQPDFKYEVKHI